MKRYIRAEQYMEKYRGVNIGQEDKHDREYYAVVDGKVIKGHLIEEVESKIDSILGTDDDEE